MVKKIKNGLMAIVPTCPATGCGFAQFMELIHNLMQLVIDISIVLVGAAVLYGGFLMVTSGGDESKYYKAKEAITAAVVGMVIILSAWAVVNVIITTFTNCTGQWNVFGDLRCY